MDPVTDYHLIPVLRLVQRKKIRLLQFTLAACMVGLAAYWVFRPGYKAEVAFVLINPFYTDRGSLYGNAASVSYFAGEGDIARFVAMASSDTLQNALIRKYELAKVYQYDTTRREEAQALRAHFHKALHIYREEDNEIVLAFEDKNAARAAAIANDYVVLIEKAYRSFYNQMRDNMSGAVASRIREQDSMIAGLTDTLSLLRDQYGIYDIISPSRSNLILGAQKSNGHAGYAKGIELIQNIESVKDEVVSDRARNQTLLSQYTAGNKTANQNLVRIFRAAQVPVRRNGPGWTGILLMSAFAGFVTGLCYIVAKASWVRRSAANEGT